jgi:hypothetical protein
MSYLIVQYTCFDWWMYVYFLDRSFILNVSCAITFKMGTLTPCECRSSQYYKIIFE